MHLSGAISGFVSYLINTVGDFPLTYGWEVIDKDSAVGGEGGVDFFTMHPVLPSQASRSRAACTAFITATASEPRLQRAKLRLTCC